MGFETLLPIGATILGSVLSSNAQEDAANTAANAQVTAAGNADAAVQARFDAVQKLLAPYVNAGTPAVSAQQDLLGLNGRDSSTAIAALQGSPQFKALAQQGEDAILANASATGGLRGGNTQAALAQFRPALLAQLIDQQYARLGGLTSIGQNAAAGTGNAGMTAGGVQANLAQQIGAAQAGNALAAGRSQVGLINGLAGAAGQFAGMFGGNYTRPDLTGAYANPAGSTWGYQGAELPSILRGGG